MSNRKSILEKLKLSENAAVERVLDAAMTLTPTDSIPELVDVLLKRDRRSGWVTLIKHFDHLGETIQRSLMERPRELFGPLAESLDDSTGDARANVISIVRQSADAKLVYLLAQSLMDNRDEVRQMAAESLLEAIRRYRRDGHLSADAPDNEHENLQRAVDFAILHQKMHRQDAIVHAALVFERRQDGTTWAHFTDHNSDAFRAGNSILRNPDDPLLAPALFLGLASELRPAAAHGLANAESREIATALARESFRLIDPVVAAAAETVAHMKSLNAPKREIPWTQDNWQDFLRLIEHLGLQPQLKLAWLARMLEAPAMTEQKIATLIVIAQIDHPDTAKLLAQCLTDSSERVARVAARGLLWKHRNSARAHAEAFAACTHESVRTMAAGVLGNARFDKLWKDAPALPPAVQVVKTKTLAAREINFAQQLKDKLDSNDIAEAMQGIRVLQTLSDVKPFYSQIIGLCGHPDVRICASAVRLAGKLSDPALLDLLESLAKHEDSRVRANAVEAMEQLKIANRSRQILTMLDSRHNRERANAVKAIGGYDLVTARETLSKMLIDKNPLHRISALWVVEKLSVLDMLRQVASLARKDTNPHVRSRAIELLERMAANQHSVSAAKELT
jgi:HEAT repeat protein